MVTIEVSEASGKVLDWLVTKAKGHADFVLGTKRFIDMHETGHYNYSTDWAQGGSIIERERIELRYLSYDNPPYWGALKFSPDKYERMGKTGTTPLIAAMRCYVASKLGDTVEVPEELR